MPVSLTAISMKPSSRVESTRILPSSRGELNGVAQKIVKDLVEAEAVGMQDLTSRGVDCQVDRPGFDLKLDRGRHFSERHGCRRTRGEGAFRRLESCSGRGHR